MRISMIIDYNVYLILNYFIWIFKNITDINSF